VASTASEANQLLAAVFYDNREVHGIVSAESLLPLRLTKGDCRSATVRFLKRCDVQHCQSLSIGISRIAHVKRR